MPHNRYLLHRVLEWPRSVKRLFVVVMDVCMGILAMWLAFSLRLDTLHWPEGLQWLVYALGPLLAFPIFVNQGLYRAIFRYTGITALITTGKAVAIYGGHSAGHPAAGPMGGRAPQRGHSATADSVCCWLAPVVRWAGCGSGRP